MNERIEKELALLRLFYREVEYIENGQWVLIKNYPLPPGLLWDCLTTDVCFQIMTSYPGASPYGFYVPAGIKYGDSSPRNNYTEPASNRPPFAGTWGFFSWQQDSGWFPTADLQAGSNLLNFVRTFKDRFIEGI